jgi:DNA-binding CsgD family transcriptional regulator
VNSFASDDLATLHAAVDLPELVATANAVEKGIGVWILLHPTSPQRQIVLTQGETDSLDPLAADQISSLPYPAGNHVVPAHAPWARTLVGLLHYQHDWVNGTVSLLPVRQDGVLLAVVGVAVKAQYGISSPEALARGLGLAVRKLHQLAVLQRDIDAHKLLLGRPTKSIVVATTTGRLVLGTEEGLAVLQRLRGLSRLPSDQDADTIPMILRSGLEKGGRHLVRNDLQAHFSILPLHGITTVAPLHSIEFSRLLKQQSTPKEPEVEKLTAAERRVYPLMLAGDRNKEIADKLHVSIHTIKHHCSSILHKLGCSDRILLVAQVARPPAPSSSKLSTSLPSVSLESKGIPFPCAPLFQKNGPLGS